MFVTSTPATAARLAARTSIVPTRSSCAISRGGTVSLLATCTIGRISVSALLSRAGSLTATAANKSMPAGFPGALLLLSRLLRGLRLLRTRPRCRRRCLHLPLHPIVRHRRRPRAQLNLPQMRLAHRRPRLISTNRSRRPSAMRRIRDSRQSRIPSRSQPCYWFFRLWERPCAPFAAG